MPDGGTSIPPDVHGEIVKAILLAHKGDTLEWDVAMEEERDQMREIARAIEPVLRDTCDQMSAWLEEARHA